jgi:tetratricopeptide (TPR) repeat protein
MAVSNELAKPHGDDDFEAMCHSLYRLMWNDTSCCRMGGPGQSQFGIDIIGNDGKKTVGIQCKHYNKKPFTLRTVTDDVALADGAKLDIDHMLFSTTAANKSELVVAVHRLSSQRKSEGKFTVSVDFWEEISGHLRLYPQVGRVYIRNFPGADVLEIKETTETHFRLYESDRETTEQFQTTILNSQRNFTEQLEALLSREVTPTAKGDEADPKMVSTLDLIRDMIRDGKCFDAKQLLKTLGDPAHFRDQFSRFRWHTNYGAIALQEGEIGDAAREFLKAFEFASDNEKAHLNKVHAYILLKDITAAEFACEQGIANFPESAPLWAMNLNVRLLQGDNNPEGILPESLLETIDILYAKAYLADKRGDFQLASELFYRCLQIDAASFDVKRAYLASALSWVCQDQVLAYHGQITETQRATLENAIVQLEPLEQLLPSIQSDHLSVELTNNVAIALMVLGESERGRLLAVNSLRRHPLTEGLLRIRLQELDQRHDLAEIHNLTDNRLTDLSPLVLGIFILAEISANHGHLEWHKKVMAFVECSDMKPDDLNELRTLSMHAKWVSGARKEAIKEAEAYLKNNPTHILPKIILSNFLIRVGQRNEAINHAINCLPLLGDEVKTLDVLHVAELLFQLNLYQEAEKLYARLVLTLGNDEFTRKWLICMIESDQRRRAQDTINKLSTTIRELPMFVRIEANLARCSGDWCKMRDLLGKELIRTPDDSRIALGYIGALHRLEDKIVLPEYLSSDPKFKDATVEEEFEFAKYQDFHGYTKLAIHRLYRLYQSHPGNSHAASFYLGQVLIGKQGNELSPPLNVEPGTVVYLRTSSETRIIAIDFESDMEAQCWPELMSPDDEQAKLLFGRTVGESVIVQSAFGKKEAEIIALESIYAFAASKAHAQVAAAAVPSGPIWSVKIIKESGELDIELYWRPLDIGRRW